MSAEAKELVGPKPTRMFPLVFAVARALLGMFFRPRWQHADRVPTHGPVVIVSNHVSMVDPPVLGLGLPWRRTIRFMAKEELFDRGPMGWFVRTVSAFPVKRGVADRGAIRVALDILKRGGIVGVFPEGHRIRGDMVAEIHQGAAFLANMAGATIVPAAVLGTEQLWPTMKRPRFAKVTVVFGEPIPASSVADLPRGERVGALTDALMGGIVAAKAEADVTQREREGRA